MGAARTTRVVVLGGGYLLAKKASGRRLTAAYL